MRCSSGGSAGVFFWLYIRNSRDPLRGVPNYWNILEPFKSPLLRFLVRRKDLDSTRED